MKILLITLGWILVGLASFAQGQFGVQAGLTYNQMYLRVSGLEQSWVPGRQAGLHWRTFSSPHTGFQLGLLWEEKGFELFPADPELTYRLKEYHLSVPVQTAILVGGGKLKLGISGGAYLSHILGRTIEQGSANAITEADIGLNFSSQGRNRWQYGLQAGLGPALQLGSGSLLQLEGRYALSLSNRYEPNLTQAGSLNTTQQQTISLAVVWWWGKLNASTQ